MRKIMLLLLFSLLFISFSRAQYVTLEGRQFKDENGNDFYPVVCNYSTEYLFTTAEPFFPSPGKDHDGYCYDCNSFMSCLDQIQQNFDTISAMNFNAIRLFMLNPIYFGATKDNIDGWAIKAYDYDFLNSVDCWTDLPPNSYSKPIYLSQSFGPDTVLDRILQYYDSVLLRAARSSIKVLLNVGAAKGDYSPVFRSGYSTYLALVADHFGSGTPVAGSKEDSIRKAILAYVILHEAGLSWDQSTLWPSVTTGHSKQDVCQFISELYDTLKQHDPHHLVTLGGIPIDLFEFDPGVMKLDFYSPHIYTIKRTYMGNDFFQGMVDEAHSWFYWLANNVPMPYIIGETGFRSKYMEDTHPGNHGTNLQQKQYADSTLKHTRSCKASGYSWWYYQDYDWHNKYNTECFWGLLGRNPITWETEKKPVVAAFEAFNPATPPGAMTKPASYYDPYHHAEYAPGTNIITGNIIDENGPVNDAWVLGITCLGPDLQHPDDTLYDSHYTFSDTNGFFQLIPYDYLGLSDTANRILDLKITSPSGLRFNSNWNTPPSVDTYYLTSTGWEFDKTLTDSTIGGPGQTTIQAFNSLDLQDVSFLFQSECDVTARTSVSLHSEVVAFKGSETHIYCLETFPQCTMIPEFTVKEKSMMNANTTNLITDQIELNFLSLIDSVGVMVFPNPCENALTLEISNSPGFPPPYFVEIFSNLGTCSHSLNIEHRRSIIAVEPLSPGIYYIKISTNDRSFVKCFIKN